MIGIPLLKSKSLFLNNRILLHFEQNEQLAFFLHKKPTPKGWFNILSFVRFCRH